MLRRPTQRTLRFLAPLIKQPKQLLKTASVSTGAFFESNLSTTPLKTLAVQSLS